MKYKTRKIASMVINHRNTGIKGDGHCTIVEDEHGKTVFCSTISGCKGFPSPDIQALQWLRANQPKAV